ncbi:MAG TPA: putative metallopeptidase [Myxococcales bacterium]|jgi:predicted metallopeptidase|nr:putative metallopeptidase [Myxococcales bacterium]HEX4385855.1 putative metallopeptidase [Myxococcales bacterium]
MAKKLPELSHIKAARILFIAGEARRGSRATIKPLGSAQVSLKGRKVLYCVTLRPLFFRASSPEQRVETLLHELLHVSDVFDGELHHGRRHAAMPQGKFKALLKPLVKRYLSTGDPALLSGLGHDGEVVARQWLERPAGKAGKQQPYDEKHLFLGPVQMITERPLDS